MGKRDRLSISRIAETYERKGCNVSATCKALKISRKTFYQWREKYKNLDDKLWETEEALLDLSESKLLQNIQEGKETSLIFHLKTKGKHRGYIERVEQDVSINPFLELMKVASSEED